MPDAPLDLRLRHRGLVVAHNNGTSIIVNVLIARSHAAYYIKNTYRAQILFDLRVGVLPTVTVFIQIWHKSFASMCLIRITCITCLYTLHTQFEAIILLKL